MKSCKATHAHKYNPIANMLYLIACDVDIRKVIDTNFHRFKSDVIFVLVFVDHVPHYKYTFTIDGHDTYLSIIVTWAEDFLTTLETLCTFKCLVMQDENVNTVALYRVVGIENREFYEKKLHSVPCVAYKFLDDVVVQCRNCGQENCNDMGTGLLCVEWDRTPKEPDRHFHLYLDRIIHYNFFDEDFRDHVITKLKTTHLRN